MPRRNRPGNGPRTGQNTVTPTAPVDVDEGAKAIIVGFLSRYGLGNLGEWAWAEYLAGSSIDQIMIDMRDRPEYKAKFPAMEQLAQEGRAITEEQYMSYERSTRQLLQSWGIPQGMYDTPASISKLLINDVSEAELNDRLSLAASAAYTAPAEVRQALTERFNLSPGDLVGFWLDPDKALPIIQQQYQSAEITGASRQQGVDVAYDIADKLAQQGVTYAQALQGFGEVQATEGLAAGQGEVASRDARVAAAFGDAAAAQQVQRVQDSRRAGFRQGGNAAETQEGVTGLGSAGTR